tara:strand:+ start:174 stop:1133 length:960 start_codon:yes stop_codon:yes gene_type:complete
MQEIENKNRTNDFDDEIDLQKLFIVLFQGKRIVGYITFFFVIVGIIYSLLLSDIYESEALLAPSDGQSSLIGGALNDYSGLAGLAGITLPSEDTDSNSKKALELMSSLSFFENNLMPKIFLPNLMAVESWDDRKNIIIYDDSIYNSISNTWVREFSHPKKLIPSAQESFEVFLKDHFFISEDIKTGFIILSIKHQSPFLAKKWVEMIVKEVNAFYRQKDKSESEKAAIYLNKQISGTSLSEIKQVTASLLQQEVQKLTLIEANKDYVFEYIYPPSVMEQKSEPHRSLIVILFTFFGGLLGVLFVLFKYYFFEEKNKEKQ